MTNITNSRALISCFKNIQYQNLQYINFWKITKMGRYHFMMNASKNDYSNSLHSKEKDYILKFVTPPQHPITIEMLNQNLNYEFGEKNRKRQI